MKDFHEQWNDLHERIINLHIARGPYIKAWEFVQPYKGHLHASVDVSTFYKPATVNVTFYVPKSFFRCMIAQLLTEIREAGFKRARISGKVFGSSTQMTDDGSVIVRTKCANLIGTMHVVNFHFLPSHEEIEFSDEGESGCKWVEKTVKNYYTSTQRILVCNGKEVKS